MNFNLLKLCTISVVELQYWAALLQVEDSWGITSGQFYDFGISANITPSSSWKFWMVWTWRVTCMSCHHFNELSNMFSQQSDIAASKSSIAGISSFFPGNFFKSLSFVVAFQVHEDGTSVLNRRIGIEMNMTNLTPSKNIGQMTHAMENWGKKSEPQPQSPPLLYHQVPADFKEIQTCIL